MRYIKRTVQVQRQESGRVERGSEMRRWQEITELNTSKNETIRHEMIHSLTLIAV